MCRFYHRELVVVIHYSLSKTDISKSNAKLRCIFQTLIVAQWDVSTFHCVCETCVCVCLCCDLTPDGEWRLPERVWPHRTQLTDCLEPNWKVFMRSWHLDIWTGFPIILEGKWWNAFIGVWHLCLSARRYMSRSHVSIKNVYCAGL